MTDSCKNTAPSIEQYSHNLGGGHGGLMVSAPGSSSSNGQGCLLCSWARHFALIVPLSTQAYKWVPANLLLGVTL